MRYIVPGQCPEPLPPPQPNAYLPPGSLQDSRRPPTPRGTEALPPAATEQPAPAPLRDQDPLLAAWRTHHGPGWIRADALHPEVRRMIDPRERPASIRQKLRLLVATCRELEAKVTGNRAKPVAFYRVVESGREPGLEG